LQDVLGLQDALNKTLMDMLITQEFAAFPQRVLINVDVEDDATAESVAKFQAGVDRLLTLMGDKDGKPASIAEFTAANIEQYDKAAEKWDIRISRVSRVPVHHLTMTGDFPSGASLRMAEGPFITKIEDRQRAFGSVLSSAMTYALRSMGVPVEDGDLRVNWASAAPMSEEDAWNVALQMKDVGMPFEQIIKEKRGYEPDQLREILEMKQRDDAQAFSLVGDMAGDGEDA
jgi:hypothetical protein